MSTNLFWKPVSPDSNYLDNQLKFILREKYNYKYPQFTAKDIPYLNGLEDAGVKGARELISAIHEYGEVELFEN